MITPASHKKYLFLIGCGHSHISIIKKLGICPLPDTKVTLISTDSLIPYSGMLPGLIAGHYTFEDCHIDLQKLCQRAGVQFVHSEVQHIDPLTKRIYCYQHPSLQYDLLSINIGSQPALNDIKGANKHGCPIKPFQQFLDYWQHWLKIAQSMNTNVLQRIVMTGGGAASIEVLLAMHYKLRHTTSIHASFTLVCANQNILSSFNERVQVFFKRHLKTLDITIISGRHVAAINQHQLTLDDGTILDYDFSAWATHAGAQFWPAESGLKCDNKGFIQIDQYLRSVSHPDIFAVGDIAAFMTPLPKAGVYAIRQGPVLASNLAATLKQHPLLAFKPQKRFLSLLTTGDRHAIASWGPLFGHGKWVWWWKNYIDRAFVVRFNQNRR
ncbi:pyridine nucleotide-disulfide oxidoreductase family protein [Nitrosomonas sp. Nm84]|uniref:FAD-dependent oxidoreductase n=1 Tax=Nitrosomonas sp. Nm84 TaxID=200124 RepID=UPI000D75EFF8|nr:FAD-dependent oxidoreductase [Nitrosomonas sp. Nm84]PXW90737.1 pyridine nucleotide-disulfide oxidoreductase family protein [Nitrosomonas sp. Nm84]